MKICIAYESKYGNGKKCVEHLKDVITKKSHEVKLSSVREIKPNTLPQADVYVFSAPTQIGSPARKMKKFLKKLDSTQEEAKYALITTYSSDKTGALEKMEKLLQTTGMTKITDGLKIRVTGMKGPLEEGYEEKLESFANDILSFEK